MKKYSILFLLCVIFTTTHAQLLVESNGNVAVNPPNGTINSSFTINHAGYSEICSYLLSDSESEDTGLRVFRSGTTNTSHDYLVGTRSSVDAHIYASRKIFGVYAHAYKHNATESTTGRSYGVYGLAGNSSIGWNYGVFGTLYGNNYGAGVFGSSESSDAGIYTGGRFAGFFHGDVKSTDAIYASAFNTTSDYRLKENIVSVGSESTDGIMNLNVVKYNLKQRTVDLGDTATAQEFYYTDESKLLQRTHYGLIAQELQDIYPDLVYEGGDGYLSVNYMELIPLLIQSIQSLKEEIDQLKGNKKTSKRITSSATDIGKDLSSVNKISVSDEAINVTCNISSSVQNASVTICDANGILVYNSNIKERGRFEIGIKNLVLNEGIFVFSLLTDDEVDSRRFYFGK